MMFTRVFRKFLDDNRACRHIDTDGECFSSKNNLYEPIDEALFYGFFKHGNHSCVVARNST